MCLRFVFWVQGQVQRCVTGPVLEHVLQLGDHALLEKVMQDAMAVTCWPIHDLATTLWVQGQAQCCVTGPALEHMLQLGDASLLETVMRNAVVFSRMKPHQKGQIMELLSSRGLYQVIHGQQQHLPVTRRPLS